MATASDFGSWQAEGSVETSPVPAPTRREKHSNAREPSADRAGSSPPEQRRPTSETTVRVPFLPSHVRIYPLRAKRRPRSAASSYMRSTFAVDSALPARATQPTTQEQQRRRQRLLRGRASWQVEKRRLDEAKYVLQQDTDQNNSSNVGISTVPPARQGFGVRTTAVTRENRGAGSGGRRVCTGKLHQRNGRLDRCSSTRPASAPTRFYDRRPSSSPAWERAAGSESVERCKGSAPRRKVKRRPASAMARTPTNQTNGHSLPQSHTSERGRGSPLPPPAWGVRVAFASYATSGAAAAGKGSQQAQRSFEEIVVCRGRHKVVTGSAARRRKAGGLGGENPYDGRRDRWVGSLEGSSISKLWTCGRKNGDDSGKERGAVVCDTSLVDFAISPSPWGALVCGPLTRAGGGDGKQRPSSAPRRRSTTGKSPTDGFGLCGDRVRARPRSAHAVPSSRDIDDEAVSAKSRKGGSDRGGGSGGDCGGYDTGQKDTKQFSASAAEEIIFALQTVGRQSSRGVWPAQAHEKVMPPMEGNAYGLARTYEDNYQQEPVGREAELIVVARQLQPNTIVSPSKKVWGINREQQSASKKTAESPVVQPLRPPTANERPVDTPSPPSLAMPELPQAPPPPPPPLPPTSPRLGKSPAPSDRQSLGLFGSALVPAGVGVRPPQNWASMGRALQQRRRQDRQPTTMDLARGSKKKEDGRTTLCRSLSQFAPVVLDVRLANIRGENNYGNRHVRAVGLAGKALRV
ncbi:unnamed protein product, partial [Hapterophycus canaliculatus]